jgi:hypothetical protein
MTVRQCSSASPFGARFIAVKRPRGKAGQMYHGGRGISTRACGAPLVSPLRRRLSEFPLTVLPTCMSMLLNMTWPRQLLQRRDEAPCI